MQGISDATFIFLQHDLVVSKLSYITETVFTWGVSSLHNMKQYRNMANSVLGLCSAWSWRTVSHIPRAIDIVIGVRIYRSQLHGCQFMQVRYSLFGVTPFNCLEYQFVENKEGSPLSYIYHFNLLLCYFMYLSFLPYIPLRYVAKCC